MTTSKRSGGSTNGSTLIAHAQKGRIHALIVIVALLRKNKREKQAKQNSLHPYETEEKVEGGVVKEEKERRPRFCFLGRPGKKTSWRLLARFAK